MNTEWTALNPLLDRKSLMEGKLLWDSSLNEVPMDFRVPSVPYAFTPSRK